MDPCRALGPQPTWRGAPLCGRSLCEPLCGIAQMQEIAILSSSIFSHGGKVCHTKGIVPGLVPSGQTRLQWGARSWGSWLRCFPSRPRGAWGLGTPGLVPPLAQGNSRKSKPVHIQELVLRGVRVRSELGARTHAPYPLRGPSPPHAPAALQTHPGTLARGPGAVPLPPLRPTLPLQATLSWEIPQGLGARKPPRPCQGEGAGCPQGPLPGQAVHLLPRPTASPCERGA